jgi:hypothetical protein
LEDDFEDVTNEGHREEREKVRKVTTMKKDALKKE